ncbi:MAG: MlaD family protein [Planctomycetes bacterium]|nr:MlaD family protein [Planctomycetota bacterium]
MAGRKSTATMELAIGATIIAGIIILIVMLMAWGNSSSILGSHSHYRVVVNMTNVGGLKEGAPVKMGGFQIGRVASIQIRPGGTDMEIVLDIDENRLLPRGSTAKVSTAGLVGDAFMEIIPGKSAEMIKRSPTVADAERLESSPLPDISELFTKVNDFGEQLTILTTNLNDVVGDAQFRQALKSMAVNIDAMSYQANLILQRGQGVIDNVEIASTNIARLSDSLKESVEKITVEIEGIAADARVGIGEVRTVIQGAQGVMGTVAEAVEKASRTVDNIDGGVTDVRTAIATTIGDPTFASDLRGSIGNINNVTALLAERRVATEKLIDNLSILSDDLRSIAVSVKGITAGIDPTTIPTTLNSLNTAIVSMTDVVDRIKKEPVLALSVNKAADRIVKMKFDEMSKLPQYRTSDAVLDEINRWVRESLERGYLDDPNFEHQTRPYVLEDRRPYIIER